jgi:hypothetical protein
MGAPLTAAPAGKAAYHAALKVHKIAYAARRKRY